MEIISNNPKQHIKDYIKYLEEIDIKIYGKISDNTKIFIKRQTGEKNVL
jgi:hypothetical protein